MEWLKLVLAIANITRFIVIAAKETRDIILWMTSRGNR